MCPSEELFQDLLAGRLLLSQSAQVHQHVESCAACRALLFELGRIDGPEPRQGLPFVDPEHYYVEGQFARGGLGRILRARDQRLGRVVAIKQLLVDSPDAEARFRREALVTARLQHPAIIPVYEAGRWPTGEAFYAMKLVAGRSLDAVIAETRTLDERLALLPKIITVADAMAYAHEQDVIHRDLKPANILVGQFGETVVIDWGLAKILGAAQAPSANASSDGSAGVSLEGAVMGTPSYMAPEQARGDEVDARADVYALGAVLYHLLTGVAPFRGTAKQVLESVLATAPPPVEEGAPGAPRELVAIVHKAMARDAAQRYPAAGELAEDLRRFVTGQLVRAHDYSTARLAARWLKRHQLGAVALCVLALSGGVGVWRVVRERNVAERARAAAESSRTDLMLFQARSWIDRDPTATVAWLKNYLASGGAPGPAWPIAADVVGRGVALAMLPASRHELALSPDGGLAATPAGRGQVRLTELANGSTRLLRGAPIENDGDLLFSPDGKKLVSSAEKGTQLWDLESGRSTSVAGEMHALVLFSPDGRRLVLDDLMGESAWIVDVASGNTQELPLRDNWRTRVHFDPRGHLLTLSTDGAIIHVDDFDSQQERVLRGPEGHINHFESSADGNWLLASGEDGMRLWDLSTGRSQPVPDAESGEAAVGPKAWQVAWVSAEGHNANVWDPAGGGRRVLTGHQGPITSLEYAPAGRLLATASADTTVRLWGDADDASVRVLSGHRGIISGLEFSRDGKTLQSVAADDAVRVWRVGDLPRVLARATKGVKQLALSPDGSAFVTAGLGVTQLWENGRPRSLAAGSTAAAVAWSPDGRWAAASNGESIELCPRAGACRTLTGAGIVAEVAFSPDGHSLAAAGERGVRLWDLAALVERTLSGDGADYWHLAFSPDSAQLAVGGFDGRVSVWDLRSGRRRLFDGHQGSVSRLRFSPDGALLASGSSDSTVQLWNLATGKSQRFAELHSAVTSLAISPDNKLAVVDASGLIRLWDPSSGRVRLLDGHRGAIYDLSFSHDGKLLASGSEDRTVWIWDVAAAHPAQVLRGHQGPVNRVVFAADDRTLYSGSDDGTVRSWPLEPALGPNTSAALGAWLAQLSSVVIDADGAPSPPATP